MVEILGKEEVGYVPKLFPGYTLLVIGSLGAM